MATNGSIDSGGYQGRCLRFEWGTNSTNATTNTRNIWYKITAIGGTSSYYYHHNDYVNINGTRVYTGSDSHQVYTNDVLESGNMDIDQDDYSTLTVEMHGGIYQRTDNIDTDHSWNLDEIPRYAEIENFSVQSIGLNSVTLYYKVSRNANIYCKVDGGSYGSPKVQNTTSGTFTITGLTPNTQHSFKILARATVSGLDRESSTKYATTLDIGRISNVANIEHGDSLILATTNPSGKALNLVMKIGNTQIFSKSVMTGNNIINFTDEELDNIYKLYGSNNQLSATLILTTDNNSNYNDNKTITITLTGNQKTGHIKNTSWKKTQRWLKVNGTWKKVVRWIKINGQWKRCI